MGIGSLVELIDDSNWSIGFEILVQKPIKGKIYTIRDIGPHLTIKRSVAILLEEIVNPKMQALSGDYGEPCFKPFRFRELLPPIAIEQELKQEEVSWV